MRLPPWLSQDILSPSSKNTLNYIKEKKLHLVCLEAKCPNLERCLRRNSITFQILGNICTRNCRFCAQRKEKKGGGPDYKEVVNLVEVIKLLNIDYAIITSPARDDLDDGGSSFFFFTVEKLKSNIPELKVEILVPDFGGREDSWEIVVNSRCDVFAHNIETVPSLFRRVRDGIYDSSLSLLYFARRKGKITKTSLMLGLGEGEDEIRKVFRDLRDIGLDILYIYQYLRPHKDLYPVKRFYAPEEFKDIEEEARELGLRVVFSSPTLRSSYRAKEAYLATKRLANQ